MLLYVERQHHTGGSVLVNSIIAVAMIMALPLAPLRAEDPGQAAWEETIHSLFAEASVEVVECGPSIRERLVKKDTDIAICGKSGLSIQEFQQTWRQSITSLNRQGSEIETISKKASTLVPTGRMKNCLA